jgi:hypothetical protein
MRRMGKPAVYDKLIGSTRVFLAAETVAAGSIRSAADDGSKIEQRRHSMSGLQSDEDRQRGFF